MAFRGIQCLDKPKKTDPEKILFAVHGYLILFDIIQYMYVTMYIYIVYIYIHVYTNISWLNTVILCNMIFSSTLDQWNGRC